MLKAMERAFKQRKGIQVVGASTRIKALPSQVGIDFDREYASQAMKNAPKVPINPRNQSLSINRRELGGDLAATESSPFDNGGRVGEINGSPAIDFGGLVIHRLAMVLGGWSLVKTLKT